MLGCSSTGYPEPLMNLAGTKLFALQQSRNYPKAVAIGQGFKEMIREAIFSQSAKHKMPEQTRQ